MEQYLQPAMEYLHHHPLMGIWITFAIAFIESLPILGTLFPGSVTMTAIGVLIGSAVLPPTSTCLSAILGAFLGDCLGFWLGSRYHQKIRVVWPLNKLSRYISYSENFFRKHGGKSIIIGRFIGPTRAAMPLIAGILRYKWSQFLPAGIFAAIAWSLVYMGPGVLLGALAMEFSHGEITKVFFSGLAVIVGLWLSFWLLQYFFKQLSRAINYPIQRAWAALNQPDNSGFFVRLIRNQQNPNDYHQLKWLLLFLLSGLLFLLIWFDVIHHAWVSHINEPLFYLIQSFRTPSLDRFWVLMTTLGTPEALLVSSLLATLGLAICQQWRAGAHLIVLGFLSAAGATTIKKIYFSARPTGFAWVDPSASFPSGHVTLSVAIFGFLAFLTAQIVPRQWRRFVYIFFILLILLISISRLFLGQHWFTDVLGAWFLGLSLLLLVTLSYRRMPKIKSMLYIQKKQWLAILLISLLLPWSAAFFLYFNKTLRNTEPVWPTTTLNFQAWWTHPTQSVPLYRSNRFGELAEPFNVQWAARLEDIQIFLFDHGWELAENRSHMYSTLQRLTSLRPEYNNSILPWLYQNKPPKAFFIKHIKESHDILELRLWESGIQYADSPRPLWLGILTYHTPPDKILRFPHQYTHLQSGNILIDPLPKFNSLQFQSVHIPPEDQPEKVRALHWDGNIFVGSL